MIQSSLDAVVVPYREQYAAKNAPRSLQEARDYFEKAYLVHAIERTVWTKDGHEQPLPHGGMYVSQLAENMGASRKTASYLVNQKHKLKQLVDFYSCEKKTNSATSHDAGYKTIDRLLGQLTASAHTETMQKYGNLLPAEKTREIAEQVVTQYVANLLPSLPQAAKIDYIVYSIVKQNLPLAEAKKEFEKQFIAACQNEKQSITETAAALQISQRHLRRKITTGTISYWSK